MPVEVTSAKATAAGANVSPACSAESPSPSCNCRANPNSQPPNPIIRANSPAMPVAMPGKPSRARGRIGCPPRAATRRSTNLSAPKPTTDAASSAQPQAGQPSGCPSTSGSTNASTAGVSVSRPGRSRERGPSNRPEGSFLAKESTAIPTGTLTRKTGRHVLSAMLALISRPPTTCPRTAPPEITAAYRLMARARGPGEVYVRWSRLSTCGIIVAAPTPCTKRSPIRTPVDGARPQPSEASVNRITPDRNIRRCPRMSPSRAPVTRRTAYAIVYPATMSCSPAPEACRSACIEGAATLTIVASSTAMSCPVRTIASTTPGRGPRAARRELVAAGESTSVVLVMTPSLHRVLCWYQEPAYPGSSNTWHDL